VTVEIPIVCVTVAAGLGVRGVVIPWLFKDVETNVVNKTSMDIAFNSFGIACFLKIKKIIA
jgi:hypothetical protein